MVHQTEVPESHLKAVYFYLFNRLGFQGITNGSYIRDIREVEGVFLRDEGNSKIFNIDKWERAIGLDLEISVKDFRESLPEHKDLFAYVDPPYLTSETVFSKGKNRFDHNALNEILKSRDNWILSYGHIPQAPYVKLAYEDYHMLEFSRTSAFNNSIQKSNATELLIFSHDIAEIVKSQPEQLNLF